jgi:hypothetical protein
MHPFWKFTKLGANPCHIGDRLVWVARSNDLSHWATRAPGLFGLMVLPLLSITGIYIHTGLLISVLFGVFIVLWGAPKGNTIRPNKPGARVAQWVRSLDLATHTSLSPIWHGFAPSFVNLQSERHWKSCLSDSKQQGKHMLFFDLGFHFMPVFITQIFYLKNIWDILPTGSAHLTT